MLIGTETHATGRALPIQLVSLAVLASLLCAPALGIAQQIGAPQTGARQAQQLERQLRTEPGALPAISDAPTAAPLPEGAETQIVTVGAVEVVGRDGLPLDAGSGLPVADIEAALAGLSGASPSVADILTAVESLKAILRADGYLFTNVGDPTATPDGRGGVTLTVPVTGVTIIAVDVTSPEGATTETAMFAALERIARPLEGLRNPRLEDLERASLLASDIPGVRRATFVPSPGDKPGELRLSMNVDHEVWDAVIFADNRQAPSLGPGLIGAILTLNSWNEYAATTEVALFNSLGDSDGLDLEERNTVQLTQRGWFGDGTTMVQGRALWSASAPGDELTDLGLTSEELEFELMAEHPLMRTRSLSMWGAAGFTWNNSTSDLDTGSTLSDDTTSEVWARMRLEARDEGGFTAGMIEVRSGLDMFGASTTADTAVSRVGGSGEFTLVRLEVERSQALFDRFSLFGRAAAQFTNDKLLVGDQITAGGGLYGKAYDPSEASGDYGYMVYGELRYDQETMLQGQDVGIQFYAFADYAELKFNGDNVLPQDDLASVGVGVRVNFQQTNLEFEVANPVGPALARNNSKDPRFFFSLIQRF
jgi:hemolysin activation/secretion protein